MLFFSVLAAWLGIGCVVALAFAASRPGDLLPSPAPVSAGARLLLIPGAMLLWPLVLKRWRGAARR
jgi:hypothetical protein